jgi:hypothetical protein
MHAMASNGYARNTAFDVIVIASPKHYVHAVRYAL